MFRNLSIKNYDFKLIVYVVTLNIIGILAVGSANASMQMRQIEGAIMGFFLMVVVSLFDYKVILKFYWLWYGINAALLLAVLLAGETTNNATRWFEIAGIRFQPSETAKILLIIFFAQFIMKYRDKINTVQFIISYFVVAMLPLYLIFSQPDLSTTLVVFVVILTLLFLAGLDYRVIIGALLVVIPSSIIFISIILKEGQTLLNGYQRKRILSFFYPEKFVDDAYQQINSVIAIGSGRLTGKGLNNNIISSLKNGKFIIMPDTDFIFAVIGEELGFIGSLAVILLLFLICFECFSIARRAQDKAGLCIAAGIGTLIGIQSFFNIGVATFILPNTGLPLPFVSYGLTSLVSSYIGIGFALNVGFRSGKKRELRDTVI
jgi:rod shape determining protein RodA